jgi:glycosyltransferase involved in cell wall biosynthesis
MTTSSSLTPTPSLATRPASPAAADPYADIPELLGEVLIPVSVAPQPCEDIVARVSRTLVRLDELSELIALENDYQPATLPYELPKGFRLSIVIPVYNEERTIGRVLSRVAALPVPKEIIVVDDASTDGTQRVLQAVDKARGVHTIIKPTNEGKGAALRTAFRRATGDVVVVQDADLEYDPRDIVGLIRPIVEGRADVVYGSRFIDPAQDRSLVHRLGNRVLTWASNVTTGLELTDMETCYKAFRRDTLRAIEIQQNRFGFEPEVTAKLARRNYRFTEVAVSYSARSYAEGKKIGLRDLANALWCIARYGVCD